MIDTAQSLITDALGLIGVTGGYNQITAEEGQLSLRVLNRMIDNWNLTALLVYSVNINTFPFVSGQQAYTLGTGGNFNIPRPVRIERMSITYPGSGTSVVELPLNQLNVQDWQETTVKQVTSTFPFNCYNDCNFPLMNLHFWPIPTGPANLVLYTWDIAPEFVNMTDQVELPQGYTEAIVNNLAVKLAPYFDRVPSEQVVSDAVESKHQIDDINSGSLNQVYDPMFTRRGSNPNALRSHGWYVP